MVDRQNEKKKKWMPAEHSGVYSGGGEHCQLNFERITCHLQIS